MPAWQLCYDCLFHAMVLWSVQENKVSCVGQGSLKMYK